MINLGIIRKIKESKIFMYYTMIRFLYFAVIPII